MNSTVEILLSTYNGSKYLQEQLDSIIQQDYPHWKLLIRDDGSTDNTLTILHEYVLRYPDKIELIKDDEGNLSHSKSFSKLLRLSTADFVMYCDQDDYWYPAKISSMLSVMLVAETEHTQMPLIVFSDLHVADSNLKIVDESFLKKVHYSTKSGQQVFFLRNYIPGCNCMFNRKLIQQALKTENLLWQHDHWLLMVCSIAGKLVCIEKPLMKYRIHDNNTIGYFPPPTSAFKDIKTIFKFGFQNKKYRDSLHANNIRQIQNICSVIPSAISKEAKYISNIDNSSYFSRKIKNITIPFVLETNCLKQLTYIICF